MARVEDLKVPSSFKEYTLTGPAAEPEVCGPAVRVGVVIDDEEVDEGDLEEGSLVRAAKADDEEFEGEEEQLEFDEADFLNSVDLLETAMKRLDQVMDDPRVVCPNTLRNLIRNTRLDIYAFIRNFVNVDDEVDVKAQKMFAESIAEGLEIDLSKLDRP